MRSSALVLLLATSVGVAAATTVSRSGHRNVYSTKSLLRKAISSNLRMASLPSTMALRARASDVAQKPAANVAQSPIAARPDRPGAVLERKRRTDYVAFDPSRFPGPFSKTKILATVGPASDTFEMLEKLWLAGVDVFRINLSHGSHEKHREVVKNIRDLEEKYMCSIGILLDLQGPKLRVGKFKDGPIMLEKGAKFRLDMSDELGDVNRVTLPHPEIFAALKPGTSLLLDDGKVKLRIIDCGPDFAETEVEVPGKLSERKGVNVPEVTLPISAMTEKDKQDALFGKEVGVDWMALSFVQKAEDIVELRNLVGAGTVKIMAKIEKPTAVNDLERIAEEVDGIMVARGDLGVELSPHQVPVVQKRIVSLMRKIGKPVVVATQMLESMINSPTPTRAEANDVANAIYDGADAVMLSAESAAGTYPIEAVTTMESIIREVEGNPEYRIRMESGASIQPQAQDAMIPAARTLARNINASAIVCFTTWGRIAQRLSQERSTRPIIALSNSETTARRLALSWGVYPVFTACDTTECVSADQINYDDNFSFDQVIELAKDVAAKKSLAKPGDLLVVTGWQPGGVSGANIIRVVQMPRDDDIVFAPSINQA
mmetsp:Transcript_27232/g.66245  ORF Transcript_27232/g.66245 Transcript_27232/m.66245 type:complete len:603 (-) Transcript_27232:159-1967(-)